MKLRTLLISGLAAWSLSGAAGAETDLEAFRRLRSQGVAAVNAGDYRAADARLAEADARVKNHPGLVLLRARVKAAGGDYAGAIEQLDRYARMGLSADLDSDEALAGIEAETGYPALARRLAANARPVGPLKEDGRLQGPYLAESVVWDPSAKRLLISGVHARTIVQIRGGNLSRFLSLDPSVGGVTGMAIDPDGRTLWAASAFPAPVKDRADGDQARSALLKIDLKSGKALRRFEAPAGPATRNFGDLAVGPDGAVYVSDSAAGEVFRLKPGAEALEVLVPAGVLGSPQGLVVGPDGARLIVADYASGLHVVDLRTGAVAAAPQPDDAGLLGVDGLVRDGDALIAFQNGVTPHRVLRLQLDAGFAAVTGWSVLASAVPDLEEPTTGVVVSRDLVFVARSQWSDFKPDGSLRRDPPGDAVIARLRLP
ncbi:MAG TPA: hypothetical protein VD929_05725 [Caulobacteraceae bacterium]|nr:hypothetical protein [Caulobacteraceae bacterium]